MQLDLMAPMAGVDHVHHRKLLYDGPLRYKDSFSKACNCIMFSHHKYHIYVTQPDKIGLIAA